MGGTALKLPRADCFKICMMGMEEPMILHDPSQIHLLLYMYMLTLQELEENKLKLKGILETHFHADFVSGKKSF